MAIRAHAQLQQRLRPCKRCGADAWYVRSDSTSTRYRCAPCARIASRRCYYSRTDNVRVTRQAWRERNRERIREYQRADRRKKPEQYRAYGRSRYLRSQDNYREWAWRRQGIHLSVAEYNALLSSQDGVCAICKRACGTGRRLAVDHDHASGKVRGLLCLHCNQLAEKPDYLRAVLSYLERSHA